jgi:hypothetical protein
MRFLLLLPLLFVHAACWGPRYFSPREHQDGTSPSGHPAAVYALPAATAGVAELGELRLWSAGTRARYDEAGEERIELHIGFELENNSDEPLQLDLASIRCEELVVDDLLQPPLPHQLVEGTGLALPGSTVRVDCLYLPPAEVPSDVDSFSIRFVVRAGDRVVLQQVTPFGPQTRSMAAFRDDPYFYAWNSRWGPGWGPGWAVGWGPGWGAAGGPGWGRGWDWGPPLCR